MFERKVEHMAREKIEILDDAEMRKAIVKECENSSQVKICRYSLLLSMHVLELIKYPEIDYTAIIEGFLINEQWQKGNAHIREVRQAGFKIHQMAKAYKDDTTRMALWAVGQAVAAGYRREHAIVASDYAISVINLLHPNDMEAVKNERRWQLNHLREIKDFKQIRGVWSNLENIPLRSYTKCSFQQSYSRKI